MTRSKVAVIRTRPDSVLEDFDRLHRLAGVEQALKKGVQTILKDNISWHFPFPGANTTPWQLEGTIRSLRGLGYDDLLCVQNKTVVTDAFKGKTSTATSRSSRSTTSRFATTSSPRR